MAPNPAVCLRLLQQFAPLAIVAFATSISVLYTFFLPLSKRTSLSQPQRSTARWFALAISVLYALDSIYLLFHKAGIMTAPVDKEYVVYTTLCTLIWLSISFMLDEAAHMYCLPNLSLWCLCTLVESSLFALDISSSSTNSWSLSPEKLVRALRILCLFTLCVNATYLYTLEWPHGTGRQPIPPGCGQERSASSNKTENSGSSRQNEPTETQDKRRDSEKENAADEQMQQVEELGSWHAYLGQFRKFLPLLVPLHDKKLQLYCFIIPVIMVADRVSVFLGPRLTGNIVNSVSVLKGSGQFPWKPFVWLFAFKIPHDLLMTPVSASLGRKIRNWSYGQLLTDSFAHAMSLSMDFHEDRTTSEVLPLVFDTIVACGYISYVFDVSVGVVVLYTYFIYTIVTYQMKKRQANLYRSYLQRATRQTENFYRSITNWTNTTYFNGQKEVQKSFEKTIQEEIASMETFYDYGQLLWSAQCSILILGYGATIMLAAYQVCKQGSVATHGDYVMLQMYWETIARPIRRLATILDSLLRNFVNTEYLLKLHKMTPSVKDAVGASDLEFKAGKVEFDNVSFRYRDGRDIISNLSLVIRPGTTVAFVGQTGSGETTLCNKLLLRLYAITGGTLRIDGQDIQGVTQHSLRETVGIVPQDPSFSDQTVFEIMRDARHSATDEEIYEACKNAAIHEQIQQMPNGYNSTVGERGVKLSGGERQRMAVAQLFLRDPKIIVLDEATSAMDTITEMHIQDSFARKFKERTMIVIAHRLSTVRNADLIVVLDKGRIIERGTHEELLSVGGRYYRLWTKKERVDALQHAIDELESSSDGDCTMSSSTSSIIDALDDTDLSEADVVQIDGSSESKPGGLRHRLRHPFKKEKQQDSEPPANEEEIADNEDESPMKLISPRPTEAVPVEPPPRRSFSLKRRSRDGRSGSSGGQVPLTEDNLAQAIASPTTPPVGHRFGSIAPGALPDAIQEKVEVGEVSESLMPTETVMMEEYNKLKQPPSIVREEQHEAE